MRDELQDLLDHSLTPGELQVLELLEQELTYTEIGEIIHVAPTTVRSRMSNVYFKLGVKGQVGAALWWERVGKERQKIIRQAAVALRDAMLEMARVTGTEKAGKLDGSH